MSSQVLTAVKDRDEGGGPRHRARGLFMTDLDLTGRKALVTGAAQGLGEGMAQALAAAGAKVVVADVQDELGAKVAGSLGDGHGFTHLDVTDDANWEAAVADAVGQLGGLDIVVNNAGV